MNNFFGVVFAYPVVEILMTEGQKFNSLINITNLNLFYRTRL